MREKKAMYLLSRHLALWKEHQFIEQPSFPHLTSIDVYWKKPKSCLIESTPSPTASGIYWVQTPQQGKKLLNFADRLLSSFYSSAHINKVIWQEKGVFIVFPGALKHTAVTRPDPLTSNYFHKNTTQYWKQVWKSTYTHRHTDIFPAGLSLPELLWKTSEGLPFCTLT